MSRAETKDELLVGTTVAGKYRIDRLLGRGGMGAVFEATNIGIGKRVALKFLDREALRDPDAVTRFQREAEAASAVESAHIVHIFDSGTSGDGRPFLVMELLTGEDLRSRLERDGRLPLAEAVHIVGQILRALSRAHAAGIVHRDLKPDNVFLCQRDDDPMFVKLVDFGISKLTRREATADTLTRRGVVLGTAFYMSPEQAQAFRDIDGRTDLYSVGTILFEMLAGRPPHVGSVYEAVLIDICTKDAPDLKSLVPEVTEELSQVVRRALMRDRDQRFQNAREFYDALASAAPGLLRTGGLGLPRAPHSSDSDTAPVGPSIPPAHDRFVTAEGTTVHPDSAGRAQARRTLVAAIVAALAAFTLAVVLMTHRQNAGGEPSPHTSSSAQAASAPSSSTAPAAAPSAPADAGANEADAAAGGAVKPVRPAKLVKPAPTAPPPSSAATAAPKPSGGVASGLQLDTRGP
jgi:serine/threonine-protein kinase